MSTAELSVGSGQTSATERREKNRGRPQLLTDKERINLKLSPRSIEILENLRQKTEASSYAEVFKNALRLYNALIEEAEKGREFYVKDENGNLISYKIFY